MTPSSVSWRQHEKRPPSIRCLHCAQACSALSTAMQTAGRSSCRRISASRSSTVCRPVKLGISGTDPGPDQADLASNAMEHSLLQACSTEIAVLLGFRSIDSTALSSGLVLGCSPCRRPSIRSTQFGYESKSLDSQVTRNFAHFAPWSQVRRLQLSQA